MKDAIRELFPPDEYGRPLSPVTRWRIVVFGTCVSMLFFMTWALSPYGFVLAGDFRGLRSHVDDMRLGQIEQHLYDAKQSECVALDLTAKRFFSDRVMKLAREYRNLARGEIHIPPCAVGIGQVR